MPKDSWRTSSRSYREAVKRGRREKPKVRPKGRPQARFTVEIGTVCHVRKNGSAWRLHTTRKKFTVHDYLWRNETVYGLSFMGWEVKVPRSAVQVRR